MPSTRSPKTERLSSIRKSLRHFVSEALSSPLRFLRAFLMVTGIATWTVVVLVSFVLYVFFSSLPQVEKMHFTEFKNVARKRVLSRFEKKHAKHAWMALPEISRDLLYAVVLAEDRTFFDHEGVNYGALLGSLAENLKQGKPAFGGSTISQQVAKNIFLTGEKTLYRKIKEILIAKKIERAFSKNQILEVYLNVAEFGPDIFGVESAARNMFRKHPSKINAAEGAYLALMLPSPRRYYYSVFQNANLTAAKRKKIARVLRGMLYNEYISEAQYRRYIKYNFSSIRGTASTR